MPELYRGAGVIVERQFCTSCGAEEGSSGCPIHGLVTPSAQPLISMPLRWAMLGGALLILMCGILWVRDASVTSRLKALTTALAELERRLDGVASGVDGVRSNLLNAPDPVAIAEDARLSVFTIRAGGAQGSAFVVRSEARESLLVTNHHVVEERWLRGDRSVAIRQGALKYDGKIVRVSAAEDLALIRVRVQLPTLRVVKKAPKPGTSIVVIGSPVGIARTVTDGIVSGARHRRLMVTAPISPGSSGSPVLDLQGRVVAVINSKFVGDGVEGMAFAIHGRQICIALRAC